MSSTSSHPDPAIEKLASLLSRKLSPQTNLASSLLTFLLEASCYVDQVSSREVGTQTEDEATNKKGPRRRRKDMSKRKKEPSKGKDVFEPLTFSSEESNDDLQSFKKHKKLVETTETYKSGYKKKSKRKKNKKCKKKEKLFPDGNKSEKENAHPNNSVKSKIDTNSENCDVNTEVASPTYLDIRDNKEHHIDNNCSPATENEASAKFPLGKEVESSNEVLSAALENKTVSDDIETKYVDTFLNKNNKSNLIEHKGDGKENSPIMTPQIEKEMTPCCSSKNYSSTSRIKSPSNTCSRARSPSCSSYSSRSSSRSRSPSIRRRKTSPSFLDKRRITSARKLPISYTRKSSLCSYKDDKYDRDRIIRERRRENRRSKSRGKSSKISKRRNRARSRSWSRSRSRLRSRTRRRSRNRSRSRSESRSPTRSRSRSLSIDSRSRSRNRSRSVSKILSRSRSWRKS